LAPDEQPVPEAFSKQLKALIQKLSREKSAS
jgi:hypothetical protein